MGTFSTKAPRRARSLPHLIATAPYACVRRRGSLRSAASQPVVACSTELWSAPAETEREGEKGAGQEGQGESDTGARRGGEGRQAGREGEGGGGWGRARDWEGGRERERLLSPPPSQLPPST